MNIVIFFGCSYPYFASLKLRESEEGCEKNQQSILMFKNNKFNK